MSFSASTCLTNIGTTPLGPTLKIYSNPISPTSPGTFVLDVPTADVTGGNCPYVYELPDGTTSIRLSDPISGCYCDIPITNVENICITCDLNFISYEPTTVGKIVAGDISGSCDNNITDYLVYWYESSDPTTVQFTSGKGSMFSYLYQHPLEGLTAVPATSGTYSAELQKIKLDGVIYSKTGGEGTVTSDLECLPSIENGNPIIVDSLNCTNGGDSSDLPQYEHKFNYQAITAGVLPEPLSTTFALDNSQNYFVWKFRGFTVPDKIKMTLVGSAYPVPILLEYWEVGSGLPNNFIPDTFPKSASTTVFFGKATCLTGLTINSGDEILIEVIPSITNPQTSWTFYCGCLDTFDCTNCLTQFTAATDSGGISYTYPIKESTINMSSGTCESYLTFKMSADCNYNEMITSDYMRYAGDYTVYSLSEDSNNLILPIYWQLKYLYYNKYTCSPTSKYNPYSGPISGCYALGSGNTVKYEKSVGNLKVTSDKLSTIDDYFYKPYLGIATFISPFSGDNTNFGYYQYFIINYVQVNGAFVCGDNVTTKPLYIAQQSVVTTGQTGSDYWINFTMPEQTLGMAFTECDLNCGSQMFYWVNESSTDVNKNFTGTSTNGVVYGNPIQYMYCYTGTTTQVTGGTVYGYKQISNTPNETYPASADTPTSYTIIPSLSAKTCSNINDVWIYNDANGSAYNYYFWYSYELANPTLNRVDFRIYANKINRNSQVDISDKTLVYEKIGGVVLTRNTDYLV